MIKIIEKGEHRSNEKALTAHKCLNYNLFVGYLSSVMANVERINRFSWDYKD